MLSERCLLLPSRAKAPVDETISVSLVYLSLRNGGLRSLMDDPTS